MNEEKNSEMIPTDSDDKEQKIPIPTLGPEEIVRTDGKFSNGELLKKTKPYTLNIPLLIWSAVNILCCCTSVLGIVSLIFVITSAEAKEEAIYSQRLKRARMLNIFSSVLNGLIVLGTVIYYTVLILFFSNLDIFNLQF